MDLLFVCVLKDDPRTIGTVTFSTYGLFMTVVVGNLKSFHRRYPPVVSEHTA
jgi:hypothetical protein